MTEVTLTTEVEEMPEEETSLVKAFKIGDGALLEVSSEGFLATFL